MKSGRAGKWAARIFKWEDNKGYSRFLDWDEFRAEFWKNFCPLHSDTVAINTLESISYFQGNHSIDNYLNEFTDLIMDAGYTDSKIIVVKFWRGLNPQIQDAIATLAYGRPSNTSPESWYEAARIIDQNCAAHEAFDSTYPPLTPVTPGHDLPILALNSFPIVHESTICPLTVDIKATMVQELQEKLTEDTRQKDILVQDKTAKIVLPFASPNHFEVLSDTMSSEAQISECVPSGDPISISAKTPMIPRARKPKWEKSLPKKLTIATVEGVSTSLKLKVEIETTDTAEKKSIIALLDSSAMGECIDRDYAKSQQFNLVEINNPKAPEGYSGNSEDEIDQFSSVLEYEYRSIYM